MSQPASPHVSTFSSYILQSVAVVDRVGTRPRVTARAHRAGLVVSAIPVLFLAMDASMKLFGLAAAPQYWAWLIPGALAMTAMFVFASIPLMDKRSVERRPAYAEHMRKVSALVPLPPRR